MYPWTVIFPCGESVGSTTPLTDFVYCVTVAFTNLLPMILEQTPPPPPSYVQFARSISQWYWQRWNDIPSYKWHLYPQNQSWSHIFNAQTTVYQTSKYRTIKIRSLSEKTSVSGGGDSRCVQHNRSELDRVSNWVPLVYKHRLCSLHFNCLVETPVNAGQYNGHCDLESTLELHLSGIWLFGSPIIRIGSALRVKVFLL